MTEAATPIEIFCSYDYEDEEWRHNLETHLSMLKMEGLISIRHDGFVAAGADKAKTIDDHLETASVILLLISANFLHSDRCKAEMKRALERRASAKVVVVPTLVRDVDWANAPFAHLQVLPSNARPLKNWSDQDQALKDVATSLRSVIEASPQLAQNAPSTDLPPIWMIPFARNLFFTGRDGVLTQLRQQARQRLPQVINGLGGVGKTQVAVEYAYRYHQDYQTVLWASAQSQETLISSYVNIAERLGLPTVDEENQQIIVPVIKTWLERHRNWLLIIDNADELAWLPSFLPTVFGGHLLITTRAAPIGRLAQRVEIPTFVPEQGALLLMRRAARITSNETLEQADPDERDVGLRISSELGGLALALDQAGAYIEETGCGLDGYWRTYQQHPTRLLKQRGGFVDDHPEPVATTWALSFARVKEQNPSAVDLLRLCAFLAPDDILEELLSKGIGSLKPELARVVKDSYLLNEAIHILRAYSLINREPKTRSLSVHRLVQTVLRDALSSTECQQWAIYVVFLLNEAFPIAEFANWSLCERYLPHALLCSSWIKQFDLNTPEAVNLLHRTAKYLYDRTQYNLAEPLYNLALVIGEQVLGKEHPDTAGIIDNLGLLRHSQGKYND